MTFNVAAEAYDQFMGGWSRQISAPFADFAGIESGHRVLDVGCGPGILTSELVDRLGADAVAAVDPSEPFVATVRERYPGVDVRPATAEALPYPADAFDAALAQLVVHFMTDPIVGLREMARVTRPGGVVAACVWDHGSSRGPLSVFWQAALDLDANATDESRLAGARAGHLMELFEAAGMRETMAAELAVTRDFGSFDEWWDPYTQGVGPAGAYVAGLGPDRRAELRDRCQVMLPGGSFSLEAVAWAARGTSPTA